MNTEIWKVIPEFEDYQISNLGRIKSLSRPRFNGKGYYLNKEKIMMPTINTHGYLCICIQKNRKRYDFRVHQLVMIAFENHVIDKHVMVIDHINGIKTDNRLENLRIVTNRFNCSVGIVKNAEYKSSKYVGVSYDKARNKWQSGIKINGKRVALGRYDTEIEASEAYQNKLKEIT